MLEAINATAAITKIAIVTVRFMTHEYRFAAGRWRTIHWYAEWWEA